jgi:CheY-like chemotaxis protein
MEVERRPRVLCVDDNRDIADSEAELFGLGGFDAEACYGGSHALAVAAGFAPDVCVLDLNMPGMEGDELAVRLRDQAGGRTVLFVAVTAMGSDEDRRRTSEAGFGLHLLKPLDPHDLLRVVDDLWRSRRPCG